MITEENGFQWDGEASDMEFFGEKSEPTSVVQEVKKADVTEEGTTVEATTTSKKEEEEEQEEEAFFESFETTTQENGNKEEEEDEEEEQEEEEEGAEAGEKSKKKPGRKSKVNPVGAVEYLKEKGLLDYELEEGEELTEDKANEILEEDFDARLDSKIEELVEDMPEVAGNFFKFIKEGGNVNDFLINLAKQATTTNITKDIDLTQEANQELVVREQLALEGEDQETINAQIEFYKTSGKLSSIATAKYKKWEKDKADADKALLEQQKANNEAAKERTKKLKQQVADFVKDKEDVGNLKLSRKDKKELPAYMTEKSIKTEGGGAITPLQKDLYEALQDDSKAVMLAKLLRSGFDFSEVEETVEEKVAKKTKETLTRTTNTTPSKSERTGSPKKRGSLADFF